MAKNNKLDIQFSLFPFLSIIICLIGTLSLINICLILNRQLTIDTSFTSISNSVEKYVEIINRIEDINPQISKMDNLIGQAVATKNRLKEIQTELDNLEDSFHDSKNNEKKVMRLLNRKQDLQNNIEHMEIEKTDLLLRIKHQETVQKKQGNTNETSSKNIVILPSDKAKGKEEIGNARIPFFIECMGSEIIIHPTLTRIPLNQLRLDEKLKRFVDKVSTGRQSILVLMIRPNGVAACSQLERLIQSRNIRYGRIPLPNFGKIDFRQIKSMEKL